MSETPSPVSEWTRRGMNILVPKRRLSALAVVLSSGRFRTNRNIHANLQAVGSLWLFSVEVPERHVDYDAISKEVGVKQIDLCVPPFLLKPVHSHRAVCHERVIRSHTLTRVCMCARVRVVTHPRVLQGCDGRSS